MRLSLGLGVLGSILAIGVITVASLTLFGGQGDFEPTEPDVIFNGQEETTWITIDLPAYRSDGQWTAFSLNLVFDGKEWSAQPTEVWLQRSWEDLIESVESGRAKYERRATIRFPDSTEISNDLQGGPMTGLGDARYSMVLTWQELERLAVADSADLVWGRKELEFRTDSIDQVRMFVAAAHELRMTSD